MDILKRLSEFDHGIPTNNYNPHAWIRGNPDIGERVWIGAFCFIDALHAPLKIGRGCDIASGVQILTHSTVKRCITERRFHGIESAAIEIGDFSFIGTNAVILKGVVIGHHSVIAAGAVVAQDTVIPPYSIVAGVPGKIIGSSKKYFKGIDANSISVIIPAYNEELNIRAVVEDAVNHLKKITKDYEIIVINDGSKDKTAQIVNNLSKTNKQIRIIHHESNRGFTGAFKTGFQNAKKNLLFLAPADGQFRFNQLENFIEGIKGCDIAMGYRAKNDETWQRKLNSKLFHFLCRTLFHIRLKEISTVSMWRKYVVESIDIRSNDSSAMFLPEIVSKAIRKKYVFTEVPIHWYSRTSGQAKGANPKVIIKTLVEMLKFWTLNYE